MLILNKWTEKVERSKVRSHSFPFSLKTPYFTLTDESIDTDDVMDGDTEDTTGGGA